MIKLIQIMTLQIVSKVFEAKCTKTLKVLSVSYNRSQIQSYQNTINFFSFRLYIKLYYPLVIKQKNRRKKIINTSQLSTIINMIIKIYLCSNYKNNSLRINQRNLLKYVFFYLDPGFLAPILDPRSVILNYYLKLLSGGWKL